MADVCQPDVAVQSGVRHPRSPLSWTVADSVSLLTASHKSNYRRAMSTKPPSYGIFELPVMNMPIAKFRSSLLRRSIVKTGLTKLQTCFSNVPTNCLSDV